MTTAVVEDATKDVMAVASTQQARRGRWARLAAFVKRHPWLTAAVFIAL